MRIGLDFDNTVADYGAVFREAAMAAGVPDASACECKSDVRRACRTLPDGERLWMRLQGQVYGRLMHRAAVSHGLPAFLSTCRERGAAVFIVSHKTQLGHFDPERVDLREEAIAWMRASGLLGEGPAGLTPDRVSFSSTRAEKLLRLRSLGLSHFVDDLEEVFEDPDFPAEVTPHLYLGQRLATTRFNPFRDWSELSAALFSA
jgi:hypothetical protein